MALGHLQLDQEELFDEGEKTGYLNIARLSIELYKYFVYPVFLNIKYASEKIYAHWNM